MVKNKYDFIFVVLTYRNYEDLKDFFASLSLCEGTYKVIVVNAFYDVESKERIKHIAVDQNADFIEIENLGYGYGNNKGIEFAKENYDFDFLIVSNPDIEIHRMNKTDFAGFHSAVIAPKIQSLSGKMQNPMFYKKSLIALKMIYNGLKGNKKKLFVCGCAINKGIRIWGNLLAKISLNKGILKIYQAHGSFVIFSREALEKLGKVYDENIFLFAEECYLAKILEEKNIFTFYNPNIKVLHKEDGSMQYRSDISEQMVKSNVYVYEQYYHFN